jgi:hypothetical protein
VCLCILYLNGGQFIYTLDDPYIHLALAEQLASHGHYGVNPGEFASPSSSILWPFLLVPFYFTSLFHYAPLLLNSVFALMTACLLSRLIERMRLSPSLWLHCLTVQILMVGFNIYGLVFNGMEHSLQLLLAVAAVSGVIDHYKQGKTPPWLFLVLLLGPLVRYEFTAVSVAVLLLLGCRGELFKALGTLLFVFLCLGSFSFYLHSMTGDYLPNSVLVKLGVEQHSSNITAVVRHKIHKFMSLVGGRYYTGIAVIPAMLSILLIAKGLLGKRKDEQLALLAVAVFCLHGFFGRWGWFGRYEMYMLAVVVLLTIDMYQGALRSFFQSYPPTYAAGLCLGVAVLAFPTSLITLGKTPSAAQNIYLQQYQMHRLVAEHYRGRVGVNDLGLVSLDNPNYVLDYGGLASRSARLLRLTDDREWMARLAQEHRVGLVMIYESWFEGAIPAHWVKVGELHLDVKRITPSDSVVSFYATLESEVPELRRCLEALRPSLPKGARVELVD